MSSKRYKTEVWFHRFTLVDKKSMFRASYPTEYILQIMLKSKNSQFIAREFTFSNAKDRNEHYKTLRSMFE